MTLSEVKFATVLFGLGRNAGTSRGVDYIIEYDVELMVVEMTVSAAERY